MLTEKGKYIYIPSLLLIAILLIAFESDFLFRIQEQNLFLHTPLFFQQHMTKAGGLLTWAGCYLSQFFYYPILGTGILCLLWLFLMWMLQRAFRIPSTWRAVTLIPVACLVLSITTLGYWVYYLKLPGYAFDATIGSIVAVGLAWLYRIMPRRYGISTLFIVLATCLSYPLFGSADGYPCLAPAKTATHGHLRSPALHHPHTPARLSLHVPRDEYREHLLDGTACLCDASGDLLCLQPALHRPRGERIADGLGNAQERMARGASCHMGSNAALHSYLLV